VKRIITIAACAVLVAIPATALAAHSTTVKLKKTSDGKLLVNGSGFTLYMFTADARNKDKCFAKSSAGLGKCISTWPALSTKGKPVAGPGVKASKLGAIKLPNGSKQVTYYGHPLYIYSGDSGPGQTDYIGAQEFGGTWYGVSATGGKVK
jgi:predicted lipoprotein with Yx(FWY)xxD motif